MTLLTATLALSSGPTQLVLKGLDPIDLVQGREVAGSPKLSAPYLRHEYRFASEGHLRAFQKDPVRYAVQAGGACGKMGALTGKGSPDRWAVVNGKIFLFASDGCRSTFLANKDKYFAPIGPQPSASPWDAQKASAIYESALEAHGGPAVKRLKQVEWDLETPYKEGGQDKVWHTKWAYLGRDRFAHWEEWDAGRLFFVVSGKKAVEGKPDERYGVHPGERRALSAMFARHPVGILLDSGAKVVRPTQIGKGWVMAKGDIVFEVLLNDRTSRIDRVTYRDRVAGPVADVVVEYSDYVRVAGAWLPRTSRSSVNGADWSKPRNVIYRANAGVPQVFMDAGSGF